MTLALRCPAPRLAAALLAGVSADVIGLPVDQFRIRGNLKTQEKYTLHWSKLQIGLILTLLALDNELRELRNTDLLRVVRLQTECHEKWRRLYSSSLSNTATDRSLR